MLDNDIFAQLQQLAETSGSPNSVENVIFNMIIFGWIRELRAGEYAQQRTLDKVEMHMYSSGNTVSWPTVLLEVKDMDEKND